MVTWKMFPQAEVIVTHGETPYTLVCPSITVRRHENGFDTGTVLACDSSFRYSEYYVVKVAVGDAIEIKQRDKSESWVTILKGVIRRVEPILSSQGNLLNIKCDGAGSCLAMTLCGEEYGSESSNKLVDTIQEVLTDGVVGIVPKWVNDVLGSATSSGHNLLTSVANISGSFKYVYFPYKPCDKAIQDLCDIVQAIKGTNAGPHWIVLPDPDVGIYLCLATVGNHEDPPANRWPTWWRTDEAGSTLVEGVDFLNFRFQQLAKEANYILYHGRFRRPTDGDFWTENNSGLWGDEHSNLVDDNTVYKVGSYSLKIPCPAEDTQAAYIPDLDVPTEFGWDTAKLGGKYNIPTINFWIRRDGNEVSTYPRVQLVTSTAGSRTDYFQIMLGSLMPSVDTWYFFSFPFGPYSTGLSLVEGFEGWPIGGGSPSWNEIDAICFTNGSPPAGSPTDFWLDGLNVTGWVLRGARQSAAYTASNPLKLKVVTDEVGKDDSLVASDDGRLMAQLCYAQYLRSSSTPIVGTFTTPIANDILPGQLIHLHAKQYDATHFRIDKDFRVTRLVHYISDQGFLTTWDVTDDLTNANPRPIPTQINTLFAAVRPEFQDRQAASIKAREIDITQPILEKSY